MACSRGHAHRSVRKPKHTSGFKYGAATATACQTDALLQRPLLKIRSHPPFYWRIGENSYLEKINEFANMRLQVAQRRTSECALHFAHPLPRLQGLHNKFPFFFHISLHFPRLFWPAKMNATCIAAATWDTFLSAGSVLTTLDVT